MSSPQSGNHNILAREAPSYGVQTGSYSDGRPIMTFTAVAAETQPSGAIYNVMDFGAQCDGVTDDTSALLMAYSAASGGGGIVLIPGLSGISAPLSVTLPGVRLMGTSRTAGLKILPGFSGAQVVSITADKCGVQDLQIIGASSTIANNPAATGILVSGARYAYLDNLDFQFVNGYVIKIMATASAAPFGAHIDHVHEVNCAGGIYLLGNTAQSYGMQTWLANLNLEIAATLECLRIEDSNDVLVSNLNGAAGQGSATNSMVHILGACSSIFFTTPDLGVYPGPNNAPIILIENGTNGNPSGIEFHAGVAQGGTAPLSITSGGDLRFIGMTFKRSQADGVDVSGLSGECTFQGCTFKSNGGGGGTCYDVNITTTTNTVNVRNCVFESPVGSGANLITNAVNDVNHHGYFEGCHFAGSGSAPSNVFASVPQIVRNCPGYNPRGAITAPTIGASPFSSNTSQNDVSIVFTALGGMTAFKIGSTSIGMPVANVAYRVPARQTLEIDWATTAPTWIWIAD